MECNAFLDYLRDHEATSDLAESLREVLALRKRVQLIPVEVSVTPVEVSVSCRWQRVASRRAAPCTGSAWARSVASS